MNYVFLVTIIYCRQYLFYYFGCILLTEILFLRYFVKKFTSVAEPENTQILEIENRIDWTYSVTRKYLFWSWKNSYNFKIFGWSKHFRISISFNSFYFSSSASRFLFIIFTALKAFVSLCRHFRTSPYAPKTYKSVRKLELRKQTYLFQCTTISCRNP